MVYKEEFENQIDALRREKFLKAQRNKSFYKKISGLIWAAGSPEYSGRPHRKATQVEWLFLCPKTMHFVYILYSKNFDSFYVGYTKQPDVRLEQRNLGRISSV